MSVPVATVRQIERWAAVDAQIAGIEIERNAAIAEANRLADGISAPLIKERDGLTAKLSAWWAKAGPGLCGAAGRKSVELHGCMLGGRSGRDSLSVIDDKAAVAALMLIKAQWARACLSIKVSLDRKAALKALGGAHKDELAALGLGVANGGETFFVQRVAQAGTLGAE